MKMNRHQKRVLQDLSKIMIDKFPETVGLAVLRFNCGCLLACCFNMEGWQSGPTTSIPPHPITGDRIPVCLKCVNDMDNPESKGKRIRDKELFWPGGAPSEQVEEKVYFRVFGETTSGTTLH